MFSSSRPKLSQQQDIQCVNAYTVAEHQKPKCKELASCNLGGTALDFVQESSALIDTIKDGIDATRTLSGSKRSPEAAVRAMRAARGMAARRRWAAADLTAGAAPARSGSGAASDSMVLQAADQTSSRAMCRPTRLSHRASLSLQKGAHQED